MSDPFPFCLFESKKTPSSPCWDGLWVHTACTEFPPPPGLLMAGAAASESGNRRNSWNSLKNTSQSSAWGRIQALARRGGGKASVLPLP